MLDASRSKDAQSASAQLHPLEDIETQAYDDDLQQNEVFDHNVNDEEMMTLAYDLEPVTNEPAGSKHDSQASDSMPTQVLNDVELCVGDRRKCGSTETASQSSCFAPTQVFDLSDQIGSESQSAATQTFDPTANSRASNSQNDSIATQVFDAVVAADGNSQSEPATQVFDAVPATQRKTDGSPSLNSRQSEADVLSTQVFSDPASVITVQSSSPQQSTQTFASPHQPKRTSGAGKDGTRTSFSPDSCSTQVFSGDTSFPHLTLEMSECNDSHNDSCPVTPAAVRASLQQVSLSNSISRVPTPPGKSWIFSLKFQDLESPGKSLWSWKVLEIEV